MENTPSSAVSQYNLPSLNCCHRYFVLHNLPRTPPMAHSFSCRIIPVSDLRGPVVRLFFALIAIANSFYKKPLLFSPSQVFRVGSFSFLFFSIKRGCMGMTWFPCFCVGGFREFWSTSGGVVLLCFQENMVCSLSFGGFASLDVGLLEVSEPGLYRWMF